MNQHCFLLFFFWGGGWVKGPEPCQRPSAANPPFQHSWGPVQHSSPKQALGVPSPLPPPFFSPRLEVTQVYSDLAEAAQMCHTG